MFYKIKLSSTCLLFAALLFVGCGSKEDTPPDEQEEWPVGLDVYVAGFENIQNNPVARLWKNGTVENLAGSTVKATGAIGLGTEARSVFVSGNDVYVAGYDVILDGDEIVGRARLWKNGVMQNLAAGTYTDQAFCVFVSGDDVYVLGREALDPNPFPGGWAFKIWKNGEAKIFDRGSSQWQVNSLFVSDGNVYVVGCGTKPSGSISVQQPKLWKNGVAENLPSGTSNSNALSVFVSGSDVYVAGYDHDTPKGFAAARLWKNGQATNLSDGNNSAKGYGVYVSGNDVYVAGDDGEKAKLWKNGVVQDIGEAKDDAMLLNSVFVKDNDIYIAGYVEGVQEVEPGSGVIPVSYLKASLWRNGKKLNLSVGKYNESRAFSVFVK